MAADDSATTQEDSPVTIAVLDNDSDIDGNPLTVSSVTQGNNGAVTIANGAVTYTPSANFNGTDSFTYTVADGQGGTDTATVNVTVQGVNDPPVATDDSATTQEDSPVTIAVLDNDSDIDGNPLTVSSVTQGNNGAVTIANGAVTYTPSANFNGTDSFTYTVADGQGGTDTASVSVSVSAVNDPPVAANDSATTSEDTPVTINVLDNDTDPEGTGLQVTSIDNVVNGTATIDTSGNVLFTPTPGYFGTGSFNYTISDGQLFDIGTVSVAIASVNDLPMAVADLAFVTQGSSVNVNVLLNDSDPDGDSLTIVSVGDPAEGSATTNGNTVLYTPSSTFYGVDTFGYTVSDGNGGVASAVASVIVQQDPNTLPDDLPVSISFNPDTPGGSVPGSFELNVTPVSTTGINLVVAMDSSGSITQSGWNDEKIAVSGAIANLADQFAGSQTSVDVYVISYSDNDPNDIETVGKYDLVDDRTALINEINALDFQNGQTGWEVALNTASSFLNGEPANDANVMYFITDGNPVPSGQNWQGALANLNSSVNVDIEAFAVGNNININNLAVIDSDGQPTSVTSPAALAQAFEQSPLFNAQLVDFSLTLTVDGIDLGEIADIQSDALESNGLNYDIALQDIPGLGAQLGQINVFSALATFDLDGPQSNVIAPIELFAAGVISSGTSASQLQNVEAAAAAFVIGGDANALDNASQGPAPFQLVTDGSDRTILELDATGEITATVLPVLSEVEIEAIDMENDADNHLTLALSDVLSFSSTGDVELEDLLDAVLPESATIYGDESDTLDLLPVDGIGRFEQAHAGISVEDGKGHSLEVYQFVNPAGDVLATLGIDTDITISNPAA